MSNRFNEDDLVLLTVNLAFGIDGPQALDIGKVRQIIEVNPDDYWYTVIFGEDFPKDSYLCSDQQLEMAGL